MPFSVKLKDWQLRLPLKETPYFTVNERHTRLAAEITEERDARFECDRARHGEQQTVQSSLPLFQQCSIQAMMHKSHANMATLDASVLC